MGMYGSPVLTIDCSKDWLTGKPVVSMTKQSFADEADINKIIARFEKTGMVDNVNKGEPFYGDVTGIVSYQESLEIVNRAEELFGAMDANVRSRFDNDPAKMVAFLQDKGNYEEALKLGMVSPKPEPAPAVGTAAAATGAPDGPDAKAKP